MRFVTDFLWRSPLGLRINAQDTAGVTQTEDWVKIRGDQLAAEGRRVRRAHHRRAVGDAFRRSRVADGGRSSRRTSRCSSTSGSRASRRRSAVARDRRRRGRWRAPGTSGPRRHRSRRAAGRPLPGHVRARRVSGHRRGSLRRIRAGRRDSARVGGCGWSPTAGSTRPTAASTSRSARAGIQRRSGLSLEAQDAPGAGSSSLRTSGFRPARTRRS